MNRVAMAGLLSGFIILAGTAQAEIFKWVDANGKVYYSDRKINPQAQIISIKTGAETLGKAHQNVKKRLMQQQKYVNYLQSERVERKEKRQRIKQEKDKKRELCTAMQDQLGSYRQGNYRWYELDEKTGERKFLTDNKIEAKKQQLQSHIKSICS